MIPKKPCCLNIFLFVSWMSSVQKKVWVYPFFFFRTGLLKMIPSCSHVNTYKCPSSNIKTSMESGGMWLKQKINKIPGGLPSVVGRSPTPCIDSMTWPRNVKGMKLEPSPECYGVGSKQLFQWLKKRRGPFDHHKDNSTCLIKSHAERGL